MEDEDMGISQVERLMQEDLRWEISEVSDMCTPEFEDVRRAGTDSEYFDEHT